MTESQQLELKNTPMIKDALSRSRGFMSMGNREAAVEVLESVQDKLSWQSGPVCNCKIDRVVYVGAVYL